MKVTLHPAAEQDLHDAAVFYEREGSPLVAARFIREFRRVTALLRDQPELGSPRTKGQRSFSMSVFPYTVLYSVGADEIRILVVKHDRKQPGFGQKRA